MHSGLAVTKAAEDWKCPPPWHSVSVKRQSPAKTAERIEVRFGVKTLGGTRNIVLDRGTDPPPPMAWGVGEDARCTVAYINSLL